MLDSTRITIIISQYALPLITRSVPNIFSFFKPAMAALKFKDHSFVIWFYGRLFSLSATSRRLSQLNLFLNDFRRAVDELVQNAGDGEDAADDGAESCEEVAEGLLLLAVLDHEGGQLVLEEHAGHPALPAHQRHHLLVLGYGVLGANSIRKCWA